MDLGFYADSPSELFDFSDLPMREVIGLKDWSDLPGNKVTISRHICREVLAHREIEAEYQSFKGCRSADRSRWVVGTENPGDKVESS
jgi:hypothetical protein